MGINIILTERGDLNVSEAEADEIHKLSKTLDDLNTRGPELQTIIDAIENNHAGMGKTLSNVWRQEAMTLQNSLQETLDSGWLYFMPKSRTDHLTAKTKPAVARLLELVS